METIKVLNKRFNSMLKALKKLEATDYDTGKPQDGLTKTKRGTRPGLRLHWGN